MVIEEGHPHPYEGTEHSKLYQNPKYSKIPVPIIWAKTFFDPPDVQPEPGVSDKIAHGIPLAYILKNPGVVTDLLNNDSRGFIGTLDVGPKSRIFEKLDFL